jgi:hypothetical protein
MHAYTHSSENFLELVADDIGHVFLIFELWYHESRVQANVAASRVMGEYVVAILHYK